MGQIHRILKVWEGGWARERLSFFFLFPECGITGILTRFWSKERNKARKY